MIARLTRLGISRDATLPQLRPAREQFDRHDYLRLPGFIEPGLLKVIQRYIGTAGFERREHEVGSELRLSNSPVASVLRILMNDPKLFRLIRQVTGCGPIGSFIGRPYQMVARQGQAFTWHNDLTKGRVIAISINLSDARYRGGTLQFRGRSRAVPEAVPNLGFGDAIIFRVVRRLEHRVTPVLGKHPKTAFSGWFCSRPSYTSVHRDLLARSESAAATHAIGKHKSLALPSPYDAAKIPRTVVSQTTGRGTFVANIATAMCYGLNETGGQIWELMTQGHAMRSISIAIAHEFAAPRREVERDVLALAHQLTQRNLIKLIHAAGPRQMSA